MSRADALGLRSSHISHLTFNHNEFLTDDDVIAPESPTNMWKVKPIFVTIFMIVLVIFVSVMTSLIFCWCFLSVVSTQSSLTRHTTFWKADQPQTGDFCKTSQEGDKNFLQLNKTTSNRDEIAYIGDKEIRCEGMYWLRFMAQWNNSNDACQVELCLHLTCTNITPKVGSLIHAELFVNLTKTMVPKIQVPQNCILCGDPAHILMSAEFMDLKCN
ncbi:hypothetical protein TCAL_03095 [Tigriopus californicus]|uniref:Uncharacterized protein n=1 Tax=Tigriopus californicus TaxID=6832 RepID=A0A553NQF8_TIGCA|nr:uncharacterized protein LOC131878715 [Tigriopus californicus]TRY67675.1 hypothetical protein TCAL_03095 [Tigriopus californicus]|eukprot:TCALIF_03095-PA protein Name:"Protein of unknown function" AED:0.10 eAED:0.10 QI:0/1/0.33/1/0/0.33/3/0/214